MTVINSLINLRCGSCWKYLTRLVVSSTGNSSLYNGNRRFTLTIHPTQNDQKTSITHQQEEKVIFKQEENEYFHLFLSKNKRYAETIAFLDYTPAIEPPTDIKSVLKQNFENEPVMQIITYVHGVLLHSHHFPDILDDANFDRLCKTLVSKLDTAHDDHIINLLKILALWKESDLNTLFYEVCKGVDQVCLSRYRIWGHNRCILVMDYFYRLQVLKFSQFVWQCMNRLWRNPDRLTANQVVHALFLVNVHRVWHPAVHLYNLQCYLHQHIYELSVEECAIMALAFFKTQNAIKNEELLDLFYKKLEHRLSNVDSIPLNAFLKLFNYCKNLKFAEKQQALLKQLKNVVDKHSYFCCTHIALLGTTLRVRNTEVLDKVAARLVNEISTIRLKDIERTILAFQSFNYLPKVNPNPYELALKEVIKREKEAFSFPISFYSTINFLCLSGYYDLDLINKVLSEDFIRKTFKWKEVIKFICPRSLFVINNSVKIDCPQYTGNFLNPTLVKDLSKHYAWKIPKTTDRLQTQFTTTMFSAKSLLAEIFGGPEFVHLLFILPHFTRPDLLFRFVDGKPTELPTNVLSKNYIGLELPAEPGDWYALIFLGMNTVIYGTDELTGITATKLRHLTKIGYKVLCLKEREWRRMNKEERIEYVYQLMEESQIKQPEVLQRTRVTLLNHS